MKEKVIIIGSGFGGLGAGARLAAQGFQVDIFDKQDKPGGRAYVFEQNGFKFDGGPTVITAPFMFDDIFEMAGRRREDYVEFKLEPAGKSSRSRAKSAQKTVLALLDITHKVSSPERKALHEKIATVNLLYTLYTSINLTLQYVLIFRKTR